MRMLNQAVREEIGRTPDLLFAKSQFIKFVTSRNLGISTIHPRGKLLFAEGEDARGVYLLLSGSVKVSLTSSQGKVLILRIAKPGDLLGINSTMTGNPYEATAETTNYCRAIFIPLREFGSLYNHNEDVKAFVLDSFSRQISEMIDSSRRLLLSETAREKLARLILKWCREMGSLESAGIRVVHNFTQEEIGQMICASRETVSRLFNEFVRRDVLTMSTNFILIHNLEALENIQGEVAHSG